MSDPGSELAEGSKLFRLDEAILRLRRLSSEAANSAVRACTSSNGLWVIDRYDRLVGEGLQDFDLAARKT